MSLFLANCSLFGIGSEEQPSYKVILKDGKKEIREYSPYIIAKTTVNGSFKESQSKGFKILAGYIFGKNKSRKKLQMTSPVTQENVSEKIAMTAPVIMSSNNPQESSEKEQAWTMSFTMPSGYTLETLPVPLNNQIILEEQPKRLVAAYTFSGFWSLKKNKKVGQKLLDWLEKNNKYKVESYPKFAGYNPPWTLPFFRRNEMLVELIQTN